MRINQVWIIMSNGICPIHLLYSGQSLEENLFAAFVRALFSFSKDMSEGEKSISSMTLGDMDIHYLAEKNEKFFVAISAEVGIPPEHIDLYLNYVSSLFSLYYPEYIEKAPPFEPQSFILFRDSIDFFIQFTENKIEKESQGEKDLDFNLNFNKIKYSQNNIALGNTQDNIIRIINNTDLSLTGTFYPEVGNIKYFDIQENEKFVIIVTNENQITIIPFLKNEFYHKNEVQKKDFEIAWICIHPTKDLLYYGTKTEFYEFNIESQIESKFSFSIEIIDGIVHRIDKILLKSKDNQIYKLQLPIDTELDLKPSGLKEKVFSIEKAPNQLVILKCLNQTVELWDTEEKLLTLKERYPLDTYVSHSEHNKIIFLITEYNEFLIYDSNDGSLLVNYNLVESVIGSFVTENGKLIVIYANGKVKWFSGTIDRDEIAQLRGLLTKRVENVESNIIRIHTGFQKIISNLNTLRPSVALKNDLNQVKVFKQQLKKLIDDKLIERTSILRDLYFRLLGYENQVQNLIKLINELENTVEKAFKQSKDNELSGKTPRERIEEYLNLMKPRDQIGLGSFADNLQLPYEECLNHLKLLESRGLLPGFLTRGSALSIKDNVIFVKKDPKFEETGITSF